MEEQCAADGTAIATWPEVVGGIARQLDQDQESWLQCLLADPHQFSADEVVVHQRLQGLADQIVTGLLTELGRRDHLETPGKKSP